jgi:hypothetical protein
MGLLPIKQDLTNKVRTECHNPEFCFCNILSIGLRSTANEKVVLVKKQQLSQMIFYNFHLSEYDALFYMTLYQTNIQSFYHIIINIGHIHL